jgi:hypothetical protein
VFRQERQWLIQRGDFRAEWDPATRQGRIRQSANPYSIDAVLRIVHTLVLAGEGGFPAARGERHPERPCIRFRRRFGGREDDDLPPRAADVHLLTDEISYVRKEGDGYVAYGTTVAGNWRRRAKI